MERDTFLKYYRVSRHHDGSLEEICRANEIISYKAYDSRSKNEPLELKLVPLSNIDWKVRPRFEEQARAALELDHINIEKLHAFDVEDDHYILVSEYLEGETVEDWVKEHGPMPPEAVLRIGLQVMHALNAAAFQNLTHPAIQPSNIGIVAGQAAEGGWPFIKLMNFALAGFESTDLVSPFASPEQAQLLVCDFPSEVYSLGATMCFLLTAMAIPYESVVDQTTLMKMRSRQFRRFPRPVRRLLTHMLHEKPAERPQDPNLLTEEIRDCLSKLENRQNFAQRFGIPWGAAAPAATRRARVHHLPIRGLAVAILLLILGILGAFLIPEDVVTRTLHRGKPGKIVGVPLDIPEPSLMTVAAAKQNTPPAPPAAPSAQPSINSPSAVAETKTSPVNEPSPQPAGNAAVVSSSSPGATASDTQLVSVDSTPPPQIAANDKVEQPPTPAEGPGNEAPVANEPPPQQNAGPTDSIHQPETSTAESSNEHASETKHATASSDAATDKAREEEKPSKVTRRSSTTTKRPRVAQSQHREPYEPRGHASRPGTVRARVVGVTPGGNLILRLPNGRIAFVRPPDRDNYTQDEPPPRRHPIIQRPRAVEPAPPLEPFRLDPDDD